MHSVSLSHRSKSNKDAASLTGERIDGPTGLGRVTHAAIGFMYEGERYHLTQQSTDLLSSSLIKNHVFWLLQDPHMYRLHVKIRTRSLLIYQ